MQIETTQRVFIPEPELKNIISRGIEETLLVDGCHVVDYVHQHNEKLGNGIIVTCNLEPERSGQ